MPEESRGPRHRSCSGSPGRFRSVPYRPPFIWAAIFALVNYCAALAIVITLVVFIIRPTHYSMTVLVGSVVFYAITSVISFLRRRNVFCPLCRGAPLVNSHARVNAKATRIGPLGYGTSATLTLLFTQTFRCIYCGERFNILKSRSHRRRHSTAGDDQDKAE